MNELGRLYQKLRADKGYTQEQLAKILGVRPSTISACELKGQLSVDMLNRYADHFKVSTDFLLGRTTTQHPHQTVRAICKKLGITEEAAVVLIDTKKRKKAIQAKERAAKYLQNLPSDADNEEASAEYDNLRHPTQEIEHRDNARAMFLSALITDENFQMMCEAFQAGYRKAWWSHMLQHPDEYTKAGGEMYGQIPEAEINRIAAEEAVQAKALYYDCTQYFMSFLNSAIPEPESPAKKKQSRRKAHAEEENQT